jgi:hypothetical protein
VWNIVVESITNLIKVSKFIQAEQTTDSDIPVLVNISNYAAPVPASMDAKPRAPLYGRSPFELGLRHSQPSRAVTDDFYENVMYCRGPELAKYDVLSRYCGDLD